MMTQTEYIGYLIARTHRFTKKKITRILSNYDFTAPQFGVLRRLHEEDGLPAKDLVTRLFSDSSTIMDIIDRLEEKGFVKRENRRGVRRENRIFLTEQARETIPAVLKQLDEWDQAIRDLLSPRETKTLEETLGKIYNLASKE
jgi:DNA-binding MarR family transcriptional regulator